MMCVRNRNVAAGSQDLPELADNTSRVIRVGDEMQDGYKQYRNGLAPVNQRVEFGMAGYLGGSAKIGSHRRGACDTGQQRTIMAENNLIVVHVYDPRALGDAMSDFMNRSLSAKPASYVHALANARPPG